ncbi:8987_t:CDS:1, partial [Funneliformis mosseae]
CGLYINPLVCSTNSDLKSTIDNLKSIKHAISHIIVTQHFGLYRYTFKSSVNVCEKFAAWITYRTYPTVLYSPRKTK